MSEHDYTGEIRRANEDGSQIEGFLIDRLGARIVITGHKDPRRGHGYFVLGRVELPEHLKQPVDDEP